ncbi:iron(III) transport system ATP-binding protein [Devosia crocina]|uniref:Iron(III) transport system ATP-binding protein n=1 Tax=Devosia crocina TaxID=429728 RepID=A0A1I7NRU2_9HYPH|nr:ABC transporter ATP-binding protein [Devosia crocina]SFV37318.1 iron(III) transport system ATP-binding protein [Devosia crocina]
MPPTAKPAVSTQNLRLDYGDTQILRGIDLDLPAGQTLALLGPSGCGKTTLLRLVAGLLAPSAGEVRIEDQVVAGPGVFLPPERRGLGMVFQDYALWPHLSVAGNVAFPLEMRRVGRSEIERRVGEALRRVGLEHLAGRSPSALSGGQQQRVAIARAIVAEPRIVLFDEPLSNLDRELRENMVGELAGLIRSLGLTAIYVTHDQSEAFTLADAVAVMDRGRVAQLAAPAALVEQPGSAKIAEFLRLGSLVPMRRAADGWAVDGTGLALAGAPLDAAGETAQVLIPPRALLVRAPEEARLTGEVTALHYRDAAYVASVSLVTGAAPVPLQVTTNSPMRLGERIGLEIISERLRWFPAEANTTP